MTQVFLPHASRTAVLVLCLNLGRTYTFHCRRKSERAFKIVGLCRQCPVLVRSGLTLNQRVRCLSLGDRQDLFIAGVEKTWRRTGWLTLLQLCQNYMTLCGLIGKIGR